MWVIAYNSFATGNVSATAATVYVGGLWGYNDVGTSSKCYRYEGQVFYRKRGEEVFSTPSNTVGTPTSLTNLQSQEFLTVTLEWSADNWAFEEGLFPKLIWQE